MMLFNVIQNMMVLLMTNKLSNIVADLELLPLLGALEELRLAAHRQEDEHADDDQDEEAAHGEDEGVDRGHGALEVVWKTIVVVDLRSLSASEIA